ncbi:MAG: hypothetical protein E7387_04835 [Ruminococcaceae bacterium]|nr:hypothetical protein [Oscillospiraceae bacterium]
MNKVIYYYFLYLIVFLVGIAFVNKKYTRNSDNALFSKTKATFKNNKAIGFTYMLLGVFAVGLFFIFKYSKSSSRGVLLLFVVLGVALCISGFASLLFNAKAYFYIDNGQIKGKYHWFGKIDWIIFDIMGAIEVVIIIATFYFAQKTGTNNIPIEKLEYTIRRIIIETKSALPGNVIKVLPDENYTHRITIFGQTDKASGYFVTQRVNSHYILVKMYESEIFENIEQLSYDSLIDITGKVWH